VIQDSCGRLVLTGLVEVFKKKAKKLIENDTQQVTLDTVRDLIDDGAAQSRMFFENLIAK
jgi:hypothetical protein